MSDQTDPTQKQIDELLQELRIALPGVQVLLAFLLTVPFNARFETLAQTDRLVFFIGVVAAASASILMIAPSAHHRFDWPGGPADLERLLWIGTNEARAGLISLGIAITASLYVVADAIYGGLVGPITAALVAVGLATLWVILPLAMKGAGPSRRRR